jgi:hypothetical protein
MECGTENDTEIDLTQYLKLWGLKRTVGKNGITGIIGVISSVGTTRVLYRRGGGSLTAEYWARYEISPCGIYGGRSDNDKFFVLSPIIAVNFIPTTHQTHALPEHRHQR